ncbi:DUF475 domain-containing protein [Nocardioides yefusunii]|uniref:DUF475 domain-containing protein n=1 Tax=Nocardioides yefusunii TaxID=2500546 RepID=A0ABW1R0J4_9ACTN|nr:DUF475 domain-containing protein [Nocardioides yefusunii]
MIFKTFGWSFAVTVVGLVAAFLYGGPTAIAIATILIILEVSLSFDNAVVNARVLTKMSHAWRKIFLTVGIVIAVFGMRLLFPLVVVGVTAKMNPIDAWSLAMEKGDPDVPGTYGYILNEAHPSIAAFGGMFLLMIFLNFFFEQGKEHHWFGPVERFMEKFGVLDGAAVIVALATLLGFGLTFADHTRDVLVYGVIGILTYLLVNGMGELFNAEPEGDEEIEGSTGELILATGKAAFFMFMYLEVLDASFSFDGVIGAFAITSDPVIIAIGLGVGAMYVRSLTIYLVNKGTLNDYVYLEHGAHWAIGALAVLLLFTIGHHIPEVVTGLIGVGFIAAAFGWSVRHNKLHRDDEVSSEPEPELAGV